MRAARHVGEPTRHDCPVCGREKLVLLAYVFGDDLRQNNGRVWALDTALKITATHPGSSCYVVEVCRGCQWNHLCEAFTARRLPPADPAEQPVSSPDRHWHRARHGCRVQSARAGRIGMPWRSMHHVLAPCARGGTPPPRRRNPGSPRTSAGSFVGSGGCSSPCPSSASSACSVRSLYLYAHLELPSTPPPLETTYVTDRTGNHQIAAIHAAVDRTSIAFE